MSEFDDFTCLQEEGSIIIKSETKPIENIPHHENHTNGTVPPKKRKQATVKGLTDLKLNKKPPKALKKEDPTVDDEKKEEESRTRDWSGFISNYQEVIKNTKFLIPMKKFRAGKKLRYKSAVKITSSAPSRALQVEIESLAELLRRRDIVESSKLTELLNGVDSMIMELGTLRSPKAAEETYQKVLAVYNMMKKLSLQPPPPSKKNSKTVIKKKTVKA